MNERIKELIGYVDVNAKVRELAEQAGCKIDRLGYGEGNLEKFAELIVKECAEIYNKIDNGNAHLGTENYLEALHKHFGVE